MLSIKANQFFQELVNFITRSEVCAMLIEADNAIELVRKTKWID